VHDSANPLKKVVACLNLRLVPAQAWPDNVRVTEPAIDRLIQRAEELATTVSDFLAKHPEPSSVTDADKAVIQRVADDYAQSEVLAFLDIKGELPDIWQISKGQKLANAVRTWTLGSFSDQAGYEETRRASGEYEESR
jgi:hypothetical protein